MTIAERETSRLAFDTRLEDPDKPENFSAFLLEHRKGPFHERIGYGQVSFSQLRHIADTHKTITLKDSLEKRALLNIVLWGEQQSDKKEGQEVALWPSPPGDGYTESRFALYKKLQGEWFTYTVIPSDTSLIEIRLGVAQLTGQEYTKDQIRASIFPLIVGNGEHWVEALNRYFRLPPRVVEAIKQGKHIERASEVRVEGSKILAENRQYFYLAKTSRDFLELGRRLEQAAAERGLALQWIGSCGISNSAALSIFDQVHQVGFLVDILGQNSSGEWGLRTCIICHERTLVGGCNICQKCAEKL